MATDDPRVACLSSNTGGWPQGGAGGCEVSSGSDGEPRHTTVVGRNPPANRPTKLSSPQLKFAFRERLFVRDDSTQPVSRKYEGRNWDRRGPAPSNGGLRGSKTSRPKVPQRAYRTAVAAPFSGRQRCGSPRR